MKLCLGLTNAFLGHWFGVGERTVSAIIAECIPVLSKRLSFPIEWPTKEELQRNMPKAFRNAKRFNRCYVVIDCTEFF